ncbi:MAG TPA: PAS domain S-box protein [Nitrospira sp.]|nr:PAS domain S-box protein [Nitrospira sp.]
MSSTSHLAELELLKKQVSDLVRERTERDQTFLEHQRQLDSELQDLRERSDMLRAILTGTAADTGDDFFPTLVCQLSAVLNVQYAIVGEVQQGPIKKIRTIAVSAGGSLVENFEYPLVNTPCETALNQSFACFERDIRTIFPLFERLSQLGVEGYCGVPLRAKGGAVIGLLVVMDTKPLRNTDRLNSLMAVFASRAGAELQRRQAETRLNQQQRHLVEAQALAHLGSWDWDIESGNVQWSAELFRIFGRKPGADPVTHETFLTSVYPDDRGRVQRVIDDALARRTIYDVECRIVRADGDIRTIHCRGEVLQDDNGRPAFMSGSALDITDRKKVEEALHTSRENLRQALQASGTGLWDWNTKTNDVAFSGEWKRQLGYGETELSDSFETWERLLHPDDHDRAIAYVRDYLQTPGGDYRQEFRLRHQDGTYRWVEARAALVTEADGRQLRLLGSHTDVTDRKQMEELVRESEERYRTLVELSPSGVFVFCEGRTVYVNRTGALLMGAQDPQDILDRPTFEFIHPDYHQEVRENVKRLFEGGVSVHSAERVYVRLDGTTIPVQVEAGRITWDGKPAILGIFSDITERKRAEEALAKLNATLEQQVSDRTEELRLYKKIFTHSIDGIAIIDPQGRYLQQNGAHERILGYSMEDLAGNTPAIHLGEERFAHIGHVLATDGSYRGEMVSQTKSGVGLTLDLTAFAVKDADGQPVCYVDIKRDVTERNRAQEALRESEARWQQFAESVGSAFWIADVAPDERRVLYVNSAFTFIWGIEREEIYRNWSLWLESIHPDDHLRVKASHDRFLSGGATALFHCEYRIVGRDGHIRWISDRRARMAGWEHRIAGIAEDITHHKQQLALMTQTESIGKIGGWQLDLLTDRLWWSDEIYRLHETTPELYSPTVETALNFYAPESRPIIAGALEKGMKCGEPWDLELELMTAKGCRITVRVVGKVDVVNERAVRAFGTFQDITERKRVAKALQSAHDELERKVIERTTELRTSEERYRTLYDETPSMYFTVDQTGIIKSVNLYGAQYLGYRVDELVGKGVASLFLEEDRASIHAKMEGFFRHSEGVAQWECRKVRRDGTVLWVHELVRVLQSQAGELVAMIVCDDITERRKAEQALRDSEERFAKAFRSSSHPIGITEMATGRCIEVNEACLQLFGFSREEVIGNTTLLLGIWPSPEDRARLIDQVKIGKPVCNLEMRVKTKSGESRDVLVSSDVAELNGTLCLITVGNDITERKRVEVALRESEERYGRATAIGKVGVWEMDIERNRYYYGDANLKAIFGYAPEELSPEPYAWLDLVFPDDRAIAMENWERMRDGTANMCRCELRMLKKDGSLVWTDVRCHSVRDQNGSLTRLIGAMVDITERKQTEEALRISEERFAKAFQASPHPVVISELDSGRVVDANEAAWQLFGYRKEEVVGHTTVQIGLWHSIEERTRYRELLQQGLARNVEVKLYSRSGEVRHCLLSSELIELGGKRCMVTVGDDVTESKQLERALQLTQFSVDQAVEAILWVDPTGRIFTVNDTACLMLGYSRQILTTMTIHDIDPNFPVDRWAEHWSHLKNQGALAFEAKYWSQNGEVLEAEVTLNYLQYDGQEYGCAILRDIGERKRAEAELRHSHMFLRQVIDTDPNLVFAKDRDGRFTMANKAVADSYGTTVEELIGKSDTDFNSNSAEIAFFRQRDLEVMDSMEECFIPEERITDAEGRTRWLQTVKRPILDEDGIPHMVLGAATDITERKRMEEMLIQRERDLSAALQERERISQDLHDGILQSLYAVGLGLEACKPMIKQQPQRVSVKFTATLNQAIGQLNHVMGEVRNFIAGLESRVIQGGDFPTVLRNLVRTMSSSTSAKCTVRIEKAAVRQLSTEQALHIINIVREGLSNALRHSDAKRITVSLRSLLRSVRLAITDDGIGFDTSSTQGVGHGLGNMAARAQKVRGAFCLQSTPRSGTKISLDLPKETTHAHN